MKYWYLATLCFFIAFAVWALPPTPHSISGTIYNEEGGNQVPTGTAYTINNTNSTFFVSSETSLPIPGLSGRYSEVVDGVDGDIIVITSWNISHYGRTTVVLAGDMDGVDVYLNISRPPEVHVLIVYPLNDTLIETNTTFLVTANITSVGGSDSTGCNASVSSSVPAVASILDNQLQEIGNLTLGSTTVVTWNSTGLTDGLTNFTVIVECSSDQENFDGLDTYTVYDINVTDVTPPVISLEAPANSSWSRDTNVTFLYNATDPSGVANCSLYLDGKLNSTDVVIENGLFNSFLQNLSEGNHSWFVSCTDDSAEKVSGNSSTYLVMVDSVPPDFTIGVPGNNTVSPDNTVIFSYLADDSNPLDNCTLLVDDVVSGVNSSVNKGVWQEFSYTFIRGSYNWYIVCYDAAGNSNSSAVRTINITDPDLVIRSDLISVSDTDPAENQVVNINATVLNIGDENATDVVIEYRQDNPSSGALIYNTTVNITAYSNITVSGDWTASIGSSYIYVVVDPPLASQGSILEFNESNNLANVSFYVNMWQVFYGDLVGDLELGTNSSLLLESWSNITDVVGNIYVVDSDASISWSALHALGRDISNASRPQDFELLDMAMNTTQYNDSVNRTYTSGSEISSLLVFDHNVSQVSVINTTNTSAFVTGILWDTSDLGIDHYNGSQDVVFIATIDADQTGAYGVYDYEVRIPARMREYTQPDDDHSVTFYTELL